MEQADQRCQLQKRLGLQNSPHIRWKVWHAMSLVLPLIIGLNNSSYFCSPALTSFQKQRVWRHFSLNIIDLRSHTVGSRLEANNKLTTRSLVSSHVGNDSVDPRATRHPDAILDMFHDQNPDSLYIYRKIIYKIIKLVANEGVSLISADKEILFDVKGFYLHLSKVASKSLIV